MQQENITLQLKGGEANYVELNSLSSADVLCTAKLFNILTPNARLACWRKKKANDNSPEFLCALISLRDSFYKQARYSFVHLRVGVKNHYFDNR